MFKTLKAINFHSEVIYFVMNYILQYDDNMTKGKVKNKNIFDGDKWKVNASFPLLRLLKEGNRFPLLHMSCKTIKEVETYKIIHQFYVGYMSSPLLKQNKIFIENISFFISRFDRNNS